MKNIHTKISQYQYINASKKGFYEKYSEHFQDPQETY